MEKMSVLFSEPRKIVAFSLVCVLLGLSTSIGFAVDPLWPDPEEDPEGVPKLREIPKNLARWHMGSRLFLSEPTGGFIEYSFAPGERGNAELPEFIILGEDAAQGYFLKKGDTSFVIKLGNFGLLERFIFNSFTAEGTFDLYYSNTLNKLDSRKWNVIDEGVPFSIKERVEVPVGPLESLYIRITIHIDEPGEIGRLNLYGKLSVAEAKPRSLEEFDREILTEAEQTMVPYNYAPLHNGSQFIHTNSGDPRETDAMLDENAQSAYVCESKPEGNVFILDLAESKEVNGISVVSESGAGRFDFYLMDALPEGQQVGPSTVYMNLFSNNFVFIAADESALNDALSRGVLLAQVGGGETTPGEGITEESTEGTNFEDSPPGSALFGNALQHFSRGVPGGQQRISIQLDDTLNARYLAMVWTPEIPGDGSAPANLQIYEVAVLGEIPQENFEVLAVPTLEFQGEEDGDPTDLIGDTDGPEIPDPEDPFDPDVSQETRDPVSL